jgi:glycosyl transferase family 25
MRSFIIHMSASTARRANAEKLCSALPEAELVEAVDGRDPAQISDVVQHPGTLYRPHYPFALRAPEIGVFQSHRRIWRRIVEEGLEYAIITEDDLEIDPIRFAAALQLIKSHASSDSYIRLPVKQRETGAQAVAQQQEAQLILPKTIGLQCICQVVGRSAAERLLAITNQIDRPVDTLLQMHWITGQPVHAILGTGNKEVAAQIGGSTIQKKTRPGEKLGREIKRGWYRAQVNLRPQKA